MNSTPSANETRPLSPAKIAKTDPGLFGPDRASSQDKTTTIGRSKRRKGMDDQDRLVDLAQTDLEISKRSIVVIKRTRKQVLRSSGIKRLRQDQGITSQIQAKSSDIDTRTPRSL